MNGSRNNRNVVTAGNQKLETALAKYFGKKSIAVDGQTWESSDLIAAFKKEDGLITSAIIASAAAQAASRAARTETAQNDQLRLALKRAVKTLLGANNPALQEFGITVREPKPRSGETIVAAAQKAKATRVARGTVGRKKRLGIHGVVPTPTAAPSPSPAAAGGNGAVIAAANGTAAK